MSVGEDQTECPLCMEPLEMDDINFFPCTCGYQICRFCWHRIRTDENGLCPACRKQYPEDPAEFKPLTDDELQRIKKERRQKDLQRKQKAAENRKHLANVRVVQKNLVFVVGLSTRLAEAEVLKKHEYFGKFGKIHKVVINASTSYAGAQVKGPSASAYVTYNRPEDALRAINAVNNIYVDGRTLKASLGTTKYCSHFLRGAQCPKTDCMYLHELGEEVASFTKEEMQQGKHQEYEQQLADQVLNNDNLVKQQQQQQQQHQQQQPSVQTKTHPPTRKKSTSPPLIHNQPPQHPPPNTNKEAWPSLHVGGGGGAKPERLTNGNKASHTAHIHQPGHSQQHKADTQTTQQLRAPGHHRTQSTDDPTGKTKDPSILQNGQRGLNHSPPMSHMSNNTDPRTQPLTQSQTQQPSPIGSSRKSFLESPNDAMSLFSGSGFPMTRQVKPPMQPPLPAEDTAPHPEIPDTIAVSTTTDWQAAFGFKPSALETHDDDLGFDPWNESTKGLADLIEKEELYPPSHTSTHLPHLMPGQLPHLGGVKDLPPPGFSNGAFNVHPGHPHPPPGGVGGGSKMLGLMQMVPPPHLVPSGVSNTYHDVLSDIPLSANHNKDPLYTQNDSSFSMKQWQESLRALLPNINISFGMQQQQQQQQQLPPHPQSQNSTANGWPSQSTPDLSWDPAIVTGHVSTDSNGACDEPHWMASLHHLTEDTANHRLPFAQQFPFAGPVWGPSQAQHPPPGFHPPTMAPAPQMAESDGLQ